MNWWEQPVWALDLETTGTDPLTAEVVSFATVKLAPTGHVLQALSAVGQVKRWNAGAEQVHGIPESASKAGLTPRFMHDYLAAALLDVNSEGTPLVVFNASYDLTILANLSPVLADLVTGLNVIDPLVIDRALDKYRRGPRRLNLVCKHFGIELTGAHDAMSDAVAAGQLAFLLPLAYEGARVPLAELHERQVEWAREWAAGLQTHKRKTTPTAVVDGSWPVRRQAVAS